MSDAQPPLVSMAEQFTGLPMGDLIGAPLLAAAKANSAMAATQTKFLLDTCFAKETTDDGKDHYQPVLIKMTLSRGVLVPVDPSQPDQEPTISEVKNNV